MIFLDEVLFNEITGWRAMIWASIGKTTRYIGDRNRGYSWNLLTEYIVDDYLPCYKIKEGYYNKKEFLRWLKKDFLPCYKAYSGKNSVIIINNTDSYTDDRIVNIICVYDLLVRYLSSYYF